MAPSEKQDEMCEQTVLEALIVLTIEFRDESSTSVGFLQQALQVQALHSGCVLFQFLPLDRFIDHLLWKHRNVVHQIHVHTGSYDQDK